MTDGTPPRAVDEEQSDPFPRRVWYCIAQGFSLSAVIVVSWIARKFETLFNQLEMKDLPAPTELLLAVARVIRTPVGSVVVALAGTAMIVLAFRGVFDRRLKKMIVFNVVWVLALAPFTYLSLFMPIVQIQRNLSNR